MEPREPDGGTYKLITNFLAWTELREEDPLNLNILLSGGKETNKDSLSNGE